jgi:DNA-binding response OmpR family regulator
VQSLKSKIIDNNQLHELNLIDKNSNRMLELVDQLLELSKIDSGKIKLIFKDGNVSSFLSAIVDSFEFQAKERQLDFHKSIQKSVANHSFDKDVIEKIVTNLLTNAFKYTPENETIKFTASINDSILKLTICNTGSDVKKENLSQFFERFYQRNDDNPGVGIGLALVKELVECYQGRIETELVNRELSFIVTLPLAAANENSVVVSNKNEVTFTDNVAVDKNELPILLLVDDNADIRQILRGIFQNQYSILEAQDCEEAFKIAQKEIPDCIISDVMMPKMDGFAFTSAIKNNELTSFIPVVLLTSKKSDQAHLYGLKSTADAFLTKPFNNDIVKATVDQLIAERKKLHARYSQELILKPLDIVLNSLDQKFICKLQDILDRELSNAEFTSEDFATAIGMSRMQLHRKLKSLLGVSATEFIRNERLKVAADLLKNGKGTVSEIAYATGFNNISYFSKCFKEMYSVTPSEYLNSENTV